jgi:hypothetical protein
MSTLSRREILGSGVAGGLLTAAAAVAADGRFGNPDQPAEGEVNVTNPKALTDPGPQDPNLAGNEPAFLNPPATDVNGMPQFWASFNLAPKRIQNGGRARQITQDDFNISTTISGVNMRLGPGASWMQYDGSKIRLKQGKGKKRVVIPVGAPLKTALDSRRPEKAEGAILRNTFGEPWTSDGFRTRGTRRSGVPVSATRTCTSMTCAGPPSRAWRCPGAPFPRSLPSRAIHRAMWRRSLKRTTSAVESSWPNKR